MFKSIFHVYQTYLSTFSMKCCFLKEFYDQWLLITLFYIRTIILLWCCCFYILILLCGYIIGLSSIIFLKLKGFCVVIGVFTNVFVLLQDCFIVMLKKQAKHFKILIQLFVQVIFNILLHFIQMFHKYLTGCVKDDIHLMCDKNICNKQIG